MKSCKFCQQEMKDVSFTIPGGNGGGKHKFDVHYCFDCNYERCAIGSTVNHHLYKMINERMYRWSTREEDETGYLWHVGKPGVPGVRLNQDMKLIKFLKKQASLITPENIERKIKMILLFS